MTTKFIKTKLPVRPNTFEAKLLTFLEEEGKELLNAFFPKQYYAYTGLWRQLFGLDKQQNQYSFKEVQRKINSTLERLEKKGLITKSKDNKEISWVLNDKAKQVITNLKQSQLKLSQPDGRLRIFIFDIPERIKKEREEIRRNLLNSGYEMLQKSVWIGKCPLPREFLEDLKEKNLISNIHLFEIKEEGTLEDWTS